MRYSLEEKIDMIFIYIHMATNIYEKYVYMPRSFLTTFILRIMHYAIL